MPNPRAVRQRQASRHTSFIRGFSGASGDQEELAPKALEFMRDQLIAQYTIDPNTDGYGIYLVFWFGKEYTQATALRQAAPLTPKG